MHEEMLRLETKVTTALAGLNARQTQAAPEGHPEKWSIQQIVEHLLLSLEASNEALRGRLSKRKVMGKKPTLQQKVSQWVVLSLGHFPGRRSAPAGTLPNRLAALQSGPELVERMHGAVEVFDGLAVQGEQLFGARQVLSHVALGALSMEQWRRFHRVHGEHHLKQIARIRREQGL